jgi:hypothetical protein
MRGGAIVSFALYVVGFVILVIGISYGAYLAHIPVHWIVAGDIILIGLGIITGVTGTRQKDPS